MKGRYIPASITLVAGLVTSIVCLVKGIGIIRSLITLLLVLIIFYIVGRIAKFIIVRTLEEPIEIPQVTDEKDEKAEEQQESSEE